MEKVQSKASGLCEFEQRRERNGIGKVKRGPKGEKKSPSAGRATAGKREKSKWLPNYLPSIENNRSRRKKDPRQSY